MPPRMSLHPGSSSFDPHLILLLLRRRRPQPVPHPAPRLSRPQRRTLVPAPRANSGPLMTRRSDRALPSLSSISPWAQWRRTLPIFLVVLAASALAIFNYQKQSSPVVSSVLYALRTSGKARELLGEEIYFASKIPWIAGEINQLHGRVNVGFEVKGSKGEGRVRFRCVRKGGRNGKFKTEEWSLQPKDGELVSLLPPDGQDPFDQQGLGERAAMSA